MEAARQKGDPEIIKMIEDARDRTVSQKDSKREEKAINEEKESINQPQNSAESASKMENNMIPILFVPFSPPSNIFPMMNPIMYPTMNSMMNPMMNSMMYPTMSSMMNPMMNQKQTNSNPITKPF